MHALKQIGLLPKLRVTALLSVRAEETHASPRHDLGARLDIGQASRLIGCSGWTVRQTLIPRGLPHFRFTPRGRLVFYEEQITPVDREAARAITSSA